MNTRFQYNSTHSNATSHNLTPSNVSSNRSNERSVKDYVEVEMEAHKHSYFKKQQRLITFEGQQVEYKEWNDLQDLSISDFLKTNLLKAINAFLNRSGGRLYIGVTDNGVIVGVRMHPKDMDNFVLTLQQLLGNFTYDVRNANLVNVKFVPVLNSNGTPDKGLYVIKIIVQQGDPDKLYSISKENLECYIRNDRESKKLNVLEAFELIKKRSELPVLAREQEKKVNPANFVDPDPISGNAYHLNPDDSQLKVRSSSRGKSSARSDQFSTSESVEDSSISARGRTGRSIGRSSQNLQPALKSRSRSRYGKQSQTEIKDKNPSAQQGKPLEVPHKTFYTGANDSSPSIIQGKPHGVTFKSAHTEIKNNNSSILQFEPREINFKAAHPIIESQQVGVTLENLPHDIVDNEFRDAFMDGYGAISTCLLKYLPTYNTRKGYVNFKSREKADAFVKKIHNAIYRGYKLKAYIKK